MKYFLYDLSIFLYSNTGTNTCAYQSMTVLSAHFATPVYHAVILNHMLFSFHMKSQTAHIAFCFILGVTIKAQKENNHRIY